MRTMDLAGLTGPGLSSGMCFGTPPGETPPGDAVLLFLALLSMIWSACLVTHAAVSHHRRGASSVVAW
jgi:hypothetical protein